MENTWAAVHKSSYDHLKIYSKEGTLTSQKKLNKVMVIFVVGYLYPKNDRKIKGLRILDTNARRQLSTKCAVYRVKFTCSYRIHFKYFTTVNLTSVNRKSTMLINILPYFKVT